MTIQNKSSNPKGAGRKPMQAHEKVQRTQITLPPDLMQKFKELGGSKWLRNYLSQYLDKTIDSNRNM